MTCLGQKGAHQVQGCYDARPSRLPRKARVFQIACSFMMACAAFLAALPFAEDAWAQFCAERSFSEITSVAWTQEHPEAAEQIERAHEYNRALSSGRCAQGYEDIMSLPDNPALCWLEIPKLNLKAPVFHGTSDEVLAQGAGHLEGTSLPVGGNSTHAVITAHSGMRQRMFDQLDLLNPGDIFYLWVYGNPLAYEVAASQTVDPSNTTPLEISKDQDLCTLVTCRPIGVNTQRLYVHAKRSAQPHVPGAMPKTADYLMTPRTALFICACAAIAVALWWLAGPIGAGRQRQRRTRRRAHDVD